MDALFSLFSFVALIILLPQKATVNGCEDTLMMENGSVIKGIIGAIIDCGSRSGKEEKVAMEMAIKDFYDFKNQTLVLHIKNSQKEPFQAALAASDLVNMNQVQAILGPRTWEEASLVLEVGSKDHIPILSFADETPQWATEKWPFLVQASSNQGAQMKAIAAIVQSWEWHRVTIIYEDINSMANGVIPHLRDALQEIRTEISQIVALPPFASSSSSLYEELEKLKRGQCRVFVVHLSFPLALHFFEIAKEMEMMKKDYVWITTDTITSLVHSINASSISSMQGIIGVKSYFPETSQRFHDFYHRFCKKFSLNYPEEGNYEPGVFAVQAYDAIRIVALAMGGSNIRGKQLLENISISNFDGLSSKVQFMDRKLAPAHTFQIINVIGKSYRELGFWSDELGFSATIDKSVNYNSSMQILGRVFWPGGPWRTPKGWTLSESEYVQKIGVPTRSTFKQFVKVVNDTSENGYSVTGFTINVFKATLERLPYYLPYKFIPFDGTYDDLVKQVYLKKFDAVVGDVSIVASRYEYAEFTHPCTETGLVMVVPVQSKTSNRAWLFIKPFTKAMWVLIVVITVYNGFVIWLIERNYCSELKGSTLNQIGTLLCLAFTTLFSLHGEKLHSNLSRMAMVVWLFVALVITQSYTANLTSMLTVEKLEPTIVDVESLRNSNSIIGHTRSSFSARYLEEVLHFNPKNMRNISSPEEYAQALRSGYIAAAFFEAPFVKLFLAKYCKGFTTAGPTYKVGGFGFVFPRDSPLLRDVTKALLNVSESGKLRELENGMTGSETCVDVQSNDENHRLSPNSFWALFIITGGTSTVSLVIYVICLKWNIGHSMLEQKTIWTLMLAIMKHWGHQKKRFSRRVSDAEIPTNSSNTSNSWGQV